jgi:two-component system, LytTR family, sensor kinase
MFKKILLQIAFWLAILVINMAFLSRGDLRGSIFELICVLFYAVVFYMNVLFLFPRYYESHKFLYILTGFLMMLLALILIGDIRNFFYDFRDSHDRGRSNWFGVIMAFRQALWLVLIFVIGTVYSIQNMLNRQIARHKQVMEEKLQTELQLLKAQIDPHFLFNALNNIYSLTYMKSEKAPDSVLKLSEMLRYVIEDCSSESVPLKSEIAYIHSFIDFYKMKNPGKRDITFTHDITNADIHIAPMLFIPFIENSFKYSRIEEDKSGFIHLALHETEGKVTFKITNSIFSERRILNGSGKGMANVRQRLEIIYPGKHILNITGGIKEYSVELEINLR